MIRRIAQELGWLAVLLSQIWLCPLNVSADCTRLLSLAPSVTETALALGLGPQLVGISRYCRADPSTPQALRVGALLDANYEAILAQRPTLVLLLAEQENSAAVLERLGVAVLRLDHKSLGGILDSILLIGRRCGIAPPAQALHHKLLQELAQYRTLTADLAPVSVLVVVGRGGLQPQDPLYISGQDAFYSELLTYAGGRNVYGGRTAALPSLSREGLLKLNPEVIIEILPRRQEQGWSRQALQQSWQQHSELAAVRQQRIHILEADYAEIPGPRLILLLRDLLALLHPEVGPP